MIKLNLNENFISRIWENSANYSDLKTTDGKIVEIIDFGKNNSDAGPDYYDAKISIEGVLYSGCIEIHRSESDWHEHKHKKDNKYNEVILQVVFYKNDFSDHSYNPVAKKSRSIPTVILSEFLTKSVHEIWKDIINNPSPDFKLPCFPANRDVAHSLKTEWLSALGRERSEFKLNAVRDRLDSFNLELSKKEIWEKVLFENICEALGYSKNKKQFLKLATNIDIKKLRELKLSLIQIDAVLFGLGGFIKDLRFRDEYIDELKFNWNDLRGKIRKEVMDKSEWNFFRLRPVNFPTIRTAYASVLLHEIIYNDFFKKIVKIFDESENVFRSINDLFKSAEISGYWKHHYNFGKESKSETAGIGNDRIEDITVNVLFPVLKLYADVFQKTNLKNRLDFVYRNEKQKSSGNEITRIMEKQTGLKIHSVSDSQALIQLHNFYCMRGKCNDCEIGKVVFAGERVHEPLNIILY